VSLNQRDFVLLNHEWRGEGLQHLLGATKRAFSARKCNRFCVLQCVAVCCSVLQCAAVCCSVLQCVAACCSVLQCVAVCCSMLQCVAECCSVLQYVAVLFTYICICKYEKVVSQMKESCLI